MTEAEARARIERLTAHDYEPLLTTEDVDDLVAAAKLPDREGRLPTDANWIPTYDVNYGALLGWETKAARCAGDFRFEEDNQVFYREQIFAHCEKMVQRYRNRLVVIPDL